MSNTQQQTPAQPKAPKAKAAPKAKVSKTAAQPQPEAPAENLERFGWDKDDFTVVSPATEQAQPVETPAEEPKTEEPKAQEPTVDPQAIVATFKAQGDVGVCAAIRATAKAYPQATTKELVSALRPLGVNPTTISIQRAKAHGTGGRTMSR